MSTEALRRTTESNPFGEGLRLEHDFRPSLTERMHTFLSNGHAFVGSGLEPDSDGECWHLETKSLSAFVGSAPLAAADRASLLPSMLIKAIDATIEKRFDGPLSTIPRMLLLVASALIRTMIFAPTFCVVLLLCAAGTISGILPAAFAIKSCISPSSKKFEGEEYQSVVRHLHEGSFAAFNGPSAISTYPGTYQSEEEFL